MTMPPTPWWHGLSLSIRYAAELLIGLHNTRVVLMLVENAVMAESMDFGVGQKAVFDATLHAASDLNFSPQRIAQCLPRGS